MSMIARPYCQYEHYAGDYPDHEEAARDIGGTTFECESCEKTMGLTVEYDPCFYTAKLPPVA